MLLETSTEIVDKFHPPKTQTAYYLYIYIYLACVRLYYTWDNIAAETKWLFFIIFFLFPSIPLHYHRFGVVIITIISKRET